MYGVAVCYKDGDGVTIDINKAKEWYAKAAAQRNENAQTQLDRLNTAPAAESMNKRTQNAASHSTV